MSETINFDKVKDYFAKKIHEHGAMPSGVGWNSVEAQEIRFLQLSKVIDASQEYSLLDYGSGYGAMYDYLIGLGHEVQYIGYDIVESMILKGRELHAGNSHCRFTNSLEDVPGVDYAVISGTFNLKLSVDFDTWTEVVIKALEQMHTLATKGFSFNLLTKYSDVDRMRPELYYADPSFYFDYCKRNFSHNVALLHDYTLYDFTILVRK